MTTALHKIVIAFVTICASAPALGSEYRCQAKWHFSGPEDVISYTWDVDTDPTKEVTVDSAVTVRCYAEANVISCLFEETSSGRNLGRLTTNRGVQKFAHVGIAQGEDRRGGTIENICVMDGDVPTEPALMRCVMQQPGFDDANFELSPTLNQLTLRELPSGEGLVIDKWDWFNGPQFHLQAIAPGTFTDQRFQYAEFSVSADAQHVSLEAPEDLVPWVTNQMATIRCGK